MSGADRTRLGPLASSPARAISETNTRGGFAFADNAGEDAGGPNRPREMQSS
jgi:hypothetical protein